MDSTTKWVIGVTFFIALLFGFLDPLWPDTFISFKRLHIFLFNLCGGGALILYFSEGEGKSYSSKVFIYFFLSLVYAFCAAVKWYVPVLLISVPLFLIVESVRIQHYAFFPIDFFRPQTKVSQKFNQASLLCLSCGIFIAALVIINNQYLHLVSYRKLTIDVFFLGFSFPLSLITMSLMFSFMSDESRTAVLWLHEACFWLVNLGVITFFVFIIFEVTIAEITISIILFLTVCIIYYIFLKTAENIQQKIFLLSGITFLLFTGLTGIFYLLRYLIPSLDRYHEYFLLLHAMVSLYGWNLSGIFIIIRQNDFPIKLNSLLIIALHWMIVVILAPLGKYQIPFALLSLVAYALLLATVLFGQGTKIMLRK